MNLIEFSKHNYIGTIRINRPEKLNTFTKEMNLMLLRLAAEINDDNEVRVVVLTAAGEKAFCAGSDLKNLDPNASPWSVRNRETDYTFAIRSIRKPVIAMIRGYALGGGLELSLMADVRFASETAVFGGPEIKHGWVAGGGQATFFPRLVGYGRALQYMLTGDFMDAHKAHQIGLVEEVYADDRLEQETYAWAAKVAALSPIATEACKQAVRMSMATPPEISMHYENELFTQCFSSEDAKEGIAAFIEKRKPQFKGR